jgi:hypothetical protein
MVEQPESQPQRSDSHAEAARPARTETTDIHRSLSKADATQTLRRAGVPLAEIHEILEQLPDPLDLDRDEGVFLSHGLTRQNLMSRMGASP